MPGGKEGNTDIKRGISAEKSRILEENTEEVMPYLVKSLSQQITGKLKKIDSIGELEISLNLEELEEFFIISALVGYMDKLAIKSQVSEFEEELNPFNLKYEDAIKYLTGREAKLWDEVDPITEEVRANFKWIKKSTELEVTKRMMKRLEKAVEEGSTFMEWKKTVIKDAMKEGFGEQGYYLENVFRTNIINGYNVGTYREQMSAKEDFPYLMYDAVNDDDTTEICRRMDGKIYLATDPIWNDIYPGNHYQCRSGVISMTKEEFLEDGLKLSKVTKDDRELIDSLGTFKGNPGRLWKNVEKSVKIKEKDIDKINEKILEQTFEQLNRHYKSRLVETFKDSPEEIQNIVREYGPKLGVQEIRGGAYYMSGSSKIYIRSNEQIETIAHEFGHFIDNMKEFKKKGWKPTVRYESDFSEFYDIVENISRKKLRFRKNCLKLVEDYREVFKDSNEMDISNGGLQDIINGLSRGKVRIRYGHDNSYWKRPGAIQHEVYANLFQIKAHNREKDWKFIEERYPELTEIFTKLLIKY
ncbi:minor capsid protein [uncultured Ilyobacter sp.]|uniref:minor capsid protein n=1 Tax=uncultured Ilyobacter sp. TaxID=544433 RepID=UPI0029BFACE4|nr:minor capsid protein [uncultured Ilyobacter sp.]